MLASTKEIFSLSKLSTTIIKGMAVKSKRLLGRAITASIHPLLTKNFLMICEEIPNVVLGAIIITALPFLFKLFIIDVANNQSDDMFFGNLPIF